VIQTNSKTVVPFSSADRRRKIASIEISNYCDNGHALTPDNIRIRPGRTALALIAAELLGQASGHPGELDRAGAD
jgi:hypothetical protein